MSALHRRALRLEAPRAEGRVVDDLVAARDAGAPRRGTRRPRSPPRARARSARLRHSGHAQTTAGSSAASRPARRVERDRACRAAAPGSRRRARRAWCPAGSPKATGNGRSAQHVADDVERRRRRRRPDSASASRRRGRRRRSSTPACRSCVSSRSSRYGRSLHVLEEEDRRRRCRAPTACRASAASTDRQPPTSRPIARPGRTIVRGPRPPTGSPGSVSRRAAGAPRSARERPRARSVATIGPWTAAHAAADDGARGAPSRRCSRRSASGARASGARSRSGTTRWLP